MNFPDSLDDLTTHLGQQELTRQIKRPDQSPTHPNCRSIFIAIEIPICTEHLAPMPCPVHGCENHPQHDNGGRT